MALNFPLNPSDGDTYEGYVYDATAGVWNADQGQIISRFSTSATQPNSPTAGDAWFNPANGKTYIYYDGAWVESGNPQIGFSSLNNITDVDLNTPSDGQALVYDSSTSNWINETPASTIGSLSDTNIVSPSESQFLTYDSSSSQWQNTNNLQGDLLFSGAERSILTSDNSKINIGTNNISAITIDENQNVGVGVESPLGILHSAQNSEGNATFRFGNIMAGATLASGNKNSGNQNIAVNFSGAYQNRTGFLVLNALWGGTYGCSAIYYYLDRRASAGNSQLVEIFRRFYAFDNVNRIQVSLTESSAGTVNFVINSWSTGGGTWSLSFIPMGDT